jgi:hypothetical protein
LQHELVKLIVQRVYVRDRRLYAITLKSDYHVILGQDGETEEYVELDPSIYKWSRRVTEPYHVHVFLILLYGNTPPSSSPITNFTPPKTDRNLDIYQRYLVGESASELALEYSISEQRVFVIIRKFKRQV